MEGNGGTIRVLLDTVIPARVAGLVSSNEERTGWLFQERERNISENFQTTTFIDERRYGHVLSRPNSELWNLTGDVRGHVEGARNQAAQVEIENRVALQSLDSCQHVSRINTDEGVGTCPSGLAIDQETLDVYGV